MPVRLRSILAIVAVSIVIITIATLSGMWFIQSHLLTTVERDMTAIADIADTLISSNINLLKSDMSNAIWYALSYPDEVHAKLEEQVGLNNSLLALTLVEKREKVFIVDSAGNPPVHPDFINSVYVRRAFAGESVISTTRIDPASGKLVLHVCVPAAKAISSLNPDDCSPSDRVLIGTIDGMYFSNLLKNLTIWETGHIFIDDAEGYIIANPRENWVKERYNFIELAKTMPEFQDVSDMVQKMIQGRQGLARFSIDGIERFCTYRPITASRVGWSLGIVSPVNEGPFINFRHGTLLGGLICLVLSIVSAVVVSGFLEKPYNTVKRQEAILHTINQISEILLKTDSVHFDYDLYKCMGLMAASVNADRIRIFRNYAEGEHIRCDLIHEWLKDAPPDHAVPSIPWLLDTQSPNWYALWREGKFVNSKVKDFEDIERNLIAPFGVLSLLSIPLYFRDTLWGVMSFDDCRTERVYTPEEEGLICSSGLLFVNAIGRNEMENDLIHAREEALAGTEAKSHFLANMSHEMRTPLNAIIGLTQLTLEDGRLRGEDEENLGKIYNSGVTLLGLINDILDLSKIESGKFEIIPVEYDTPSLINDTVTLNRVHVGSKPIAFHLHVDEKMPGMLRGDDLRVKQIFNNILSNAFKYTRSGSVDWTVSCERDGDSFWLTSVVKDTGIGIKPEDMKKLFSDYNQVDTKSNRKIEGTGLGLAITKRMVGMMDGSIQVESEYGRGTIFTVRIRQGFVSDSPLGAEVARKLMEDRYSDHKRDRSARLVRAPLPYAKVLVVDDVLVNLDVARGLMKPYGMKVDCVTSGPEAIDLIRGAKEKYNAIFMDHMMPGMDGLEAVRIIREEIGTDYAKNVPIIALTANAIVGNNEMFLSRGFQAFLSKPIDIMALDAAINRWVRDRALEKELVAQGKLKTDTAEAGTGAAEAGADIFSTWDIPEINFDNALAVFGGDVESYMDVLKSWVKNTPPLLDKIRGFAKDHGPDSVDNYRVTVHGLKSASRSIGAQALGAQAEALEFAARDSNIDFIAKTNSGFIAEVEKLAAVLASFLDRAAAQNPKPVKAEPDRAALAELLEACKNYNIDEVDRIVQSLESYEYETSGDLVPWLREQANRSEFSTIEERLTGMI
jgi:signal transduction histidine kinase/CheY-like chemotaxis protein/HPt (histidine-containing phosphotransfer) domain-containing protein